MLKSVWLQLHFLNCVIKDFHIYLSHSFINYMLLNIAISPAMLKYWENASLQTYLKTSWRFSSRRRRCIYNCNSALWYYIWTSRLTMFFLFIHHWPTHLINYLSQPILLPNHYFYHIQQKSQQRKGSFKILGVWPETWNFIFAHFVTYIR